MQPLVTVVIPAYNAQATLAETLRSLLAQSLTDWRAVVIDDGSTDSTPMIAADFAWRDQRITHVRQENQGLAGARNRGLDCAEGRFVHFLDSDDWLTPLGLELLVQASEWSGRGAACGSWTLHGADGRPLGVTMTPPDQVVGLEHLLDGNALAPHSHLVRREHLGSMRFDPSTPGVEDYQMWMSLAATGVKWSAVDEAVACYRIRPGSMSKYPGRMLESACRVLRRQHPGEGYAAAARTTALFYATMAALTDRTPDFASARGLLRGALSQPAAFTASELGEAGYWSLVFGFGFAPARFPTTAPQWLPRLSAWWRSVAGASKVDEAVEALALQAVSAEAVAGAMLDRVHEGSPVVLAGAMGRNGRAVSRVARSRGVAVDLRDDRLPRSGLERLIDASSTVLVAPLADEAILEKLPRGVRVVRWSEVRAKMAGALLEGLRGSSETRAIGA